MTALDAAKSLCWPWASKLWPARRGDAAQLSNDLRFHGPAPFGTDLDRAGFERYLSALVAAFPRAEKRPYLFLGGRFEGSTWVAATGDIVGQMARPFCRVPAGPQQRRLRFGEFYRLEGNCIVEVRLLLDILGLAAQAGYGLLPPFDGRSDCRPGPREIDGVLRDRQDRRESARTLACVEAMLGGCNSLDGDDLASMGMAAHWHEDMVWHGPWGVGSCYGFQEFQDFAQGPSVRSFPDRRGGFHQARFADGFTACFTGWPSLQGNFTGAPFRGIAPTGGAIGQNIMDFYVRRDGKLAENWVLIDLIDFATQCGVDLLAPLPPAER